MTVKSLDTKANLILEAWLQFIEMQDRRQERIAGKNVELDDIITRQTISLRQNNLQLDPAYFQKLKVLYEADQKNKQSKPWLLSFPQIYIHKEGVEKGESDFCPLFGLDILAIFSGEYEPQGWGIETFPITEFGDNLAKRFNVEDEIIDKLITKEGLQRFLKTTFGVTFRSFESWMEKASRKELTGKKFRSLAQPYLFKATGGNFHTRLKEDLGAIRACDHKSWMMPGQPAYDYLFGAASTPCQENIYYLGAFPETNLPTQSQLAALKQAQTETLTTIQGPPGTGKTTLILQAIAQQVVSRAVRLVKNQPDISNLVVISSSNNKAVDNVIEKLNKLEQSDESSQVHFLQLNGGSQSKIKEGAAIQLETAIDYLEKNSYCPKTYEMVKQSIAQLVAQIEAGALACDRAYQQQRNDKREVAQIKRLIQALQQDLSEAKDTQVQLRNKGKQLSYIKALPVNAYEQLETYFAQAQADMPATDPPLWQQWLSWTPLKTEHRVVAALADICRDAVAVTQTSGFAIEQPTDRVTLRAQTQRVKEGLAIWRELQENKVMLESSADTIAQLNRQLEAGCRRLRELASRLSHRGESEAVRFYQTFHSQYEKQNIELFYLSEQLLLQVALKQKSAVEDTLKDYRKLLTSGSRYQPEAAKRLSKDIDETVRLISLVFPVVTSTLASARNMIPWNCQCIDRVILDEAGMTPPHLAFPLLTKTRRAIVMGDPLQIEPIVSLSAQTLFDYRQAAFIDQGLTEEDYPLYSPGAIATATAYHRATNADERGRPRKEMKLREHFRCQESIIDYCRGIAKYDLTCVTQPVKGSLLGSEKGKRDGKNLVAYHVEGKIDRNVNTDEVEAVCQIVKHLKDRGYSLDDIGIVTPYRAHADALIRAVTKRFGMDKKAIGTIHTFQGSEKSVMIFSAKVCLPRAVSSLDWLNGKPNLLNVAVSRAQELFILVGNLHFLEKGHFTKKLIEHIETHGVVAEYKTKAEIDSVYKLSTKATAVIKTCEHIAVLVEALNQAKNELWLVVPTIQGEAADHFIRSIVAVLERGVRVTVAYGTARRDHSAQAESTLAESKLQALFMQYEKASLVPLGGMGTDSQILVCDDQFAIAGTWRWLSHRYGAACANRTLTRGVQISDATSLRTVDPIDIQRMKSDIFKWKQKIRA